MKFEKLIIAPRPLLIEEGVGEREEVVAAGKYAYVDSTFSTDIERGTCNGIFLMESNNIFADVSSILFPLKPICPSIIDEGLAEDDFNVKEIENSK